MTHTAIILVKPKTNDAAASTAMTCLVNDLNRKDLIGLKRCDYWEIQLCDNLDQPPDSIGAELAEHTKIFVNPNKHTYKIETNRRQLMKPQKLESGLFLVHVLIKEHEDTTGKNALKTLHGLYGFTQSVESISYGILWSITLKADDIQFALQQADLIAATRSHHQGLLANPHSQSVLIGHGEPSD